MIKSLKVLFISQSNLNSSWIVRAKPDNFNASFWKFSKSFFGKNTLLNRSSQPETPEKPLPEKDFKGKGVLFRRCV
jgi:hypothetical protein